MATVKPFKAIRPVPQYADKVAALPYDVMDSDEAREMVKDNPYSFLHVDKAEIDLDPSVDPYASAVYEKAGKNLDRLITDGILAQDAKRCYYIYRLTMNGRSQLGIVACSAIDDYLNNVIKKHELTRADKEADRIRHVDTLNANTGPIFLTYRPGDGPDALIKDWAASRKPVCDFVSEDGIGHAVWVIDDGEAVEKIENIFAGVGSLYIADGHHRCASAVKVGQKRRKTNPAYTGEEEFNFFLSVIFPSDQLRILDYNRLVSELGENSEEQILQKLSRYFDVEPYGECGQMKPAQKHTFGMFMGGKWYKLTAHTDAYDEADPVGRLDVSILQDRVLGPILGITDPRTDSRIDFVGGIRGLKELEDRAFAGRGIAFSVFPTTPDDLMAIADAGMVMPPKSTWFEPKLRSGLFIHSLK